MDKTKLQQCVLDEIEIIKLREHSKASEKYVDVKVNNWYGSIPYYYRRTGLFIESEEELCEYLNQTKQYFTNSKIEEFVKLEKSRWNKEMSSKQITKTFFNVLLNMKWNSVKKDLPNNPNWARRIQDIKEFGYTLATNTSMKIIGSSLKGTHIMLLPIPKGGVTGYEVMSAIFKKRVVDILKATNIYELSSANKSGLLPDHKFSEIRWDEKTRELNESLSEEKIRQKFQLIDNQRNQQKREICRKCFQTNKRGILFGIEYFYKGGIDWSKKIPKLGKKSELGCIGCGWYDIQEWRESLNNLLANIK